MFYTLGKWNQQIKTASHTWLSFPTSQKVVHQLTFFTSTPSCEKSWGEWSLSVMSENNLICWSSRQWLKGRPKKSHTHKEKKKREIKSKRKLTVKQEYWTLCSALQCCAKTADKHNVSLSPDHHLIYIIHACKQPQQCTGIFFSSVWHQSDWLPVLSQATFSQD